MEINYWIGVGFLIFIGFFIAQLVLGGLLGVKDIRDNAKAI